jgi:hypothetical protein
MAKRTTTAYSFEEVAVTVAGAEVYGFFEGDDAVMVEEGADIGAMLVGADGSSIFSQSANRSARVTLKLQHTSPMHRYLTQLLARQRGGALDGVALSVRDSRSNEGGATDAAYIMQAPSDQKGGAAVSRDWVLVTGDWQRTIPREF